MKTRTPSSWSLLAVLALSAGTAAQGQAVNFGPDKTSPTRQTPLAALPGPEDVMPRRPGPAPEAAAPPLVELPGPAVPPLKEASTAEKADEAEGAFLVEADYLLMTPRRRPTDFAITGANTGFGPVGDVRTIDWDASSGFRVGAGYRLPGDGWEVSAFYTYLHASRSQVADSPPGGALFATLTTPGLVELAGHASASSTFEYDVIDLETARRFQAGASTGVRLFGGVRYANIRQNLTATYDGVDASNDQVRSRISFDGAGVRVGGEGTWCLGGGLGLYARGSGSMLVGRMSSRLTETANGGSTLITSLSDRFDKVVPVTELGLGVTWAYRGWRLSAGYEFINWFGLVDVPDVANDVDHGKIIRRTGDLSLDGLVLRAELSY